MRAAHVDHRIILCPRGAYLLHWNTHDRRNHQTLARPDVLVRGWDLPVACEGMTLGTLLGLVRRLTPARRRELEARAGVSIAPFLDEMAGRRVRGVQPPPRAPFTVLEVSRSFEIHRSAGERGLADLSIHTVSTAMGGTWRRPRGPRLGLSLSPAYHFAAAVLVIPAAADFVDWRRRKRASPLRIRNQLTLGELLGEILRELCNEGSPAGRERFAAELQRRAEEVRTRKVETIPAMKVFAELKAQARREEPELRRRSLQLWRERHKNESDPPRSE